MIGGTELNSAEFTQLLLDATGKRCSYVDGVGHDHRYTSHLSEIRADRCYGPQVPFETRPANDMMRCGDQNRLHEQNLFGRQPTLIR